MKRSRGEKAKASDLVENIGDTSPVHFWDGDWWWWDEFKIAHGPFKTSEEAGHRAKLYWGQV